MTPTYLYRKVSGRHTVGYFTAAGPTDAARRGKWRRESFHWRAGPAADRAVYLNGGTTEWSVKK